MTLTIKPEIRDAWADALESGEYQQTKGVLAQVEQRTDGTWAITGACCLGVLCDLAVKAGAVPAPVVLDDDESNGYGEVFRYGEDAEYDEGDHSYTGLPDAVIRWAGLDADDEHPTALSDPTLTSADGTGRGAASWNDEYSASFADIAAMVRAIPAAEPATV